MIADELLQKQTISGRAVQHTRPVCHRLHDSRWYWNERVCKQLAHNIATDLRLSPEQVRAAIDLLEAGNTIPFLARYRKEATHGLDEVALRAIEDAVEKAETLAARKATVTRSIRDQGLLSEELLGLIDNCVDLRQLELLYLPFKPKRRTKAAWLGKGDFSRWLTCWLPRNHWKLRGTNFSNDSFARN